jgi:hypothetical protein
VKQGDGPLDCGLLLLDLRRRRVTLEGCRRLQHRQSVEVGGCRGKLRFVAVRMEQIEGPISTVIHRTASKAAVISLEPGPYVSDT